MSIIFQLFSAEDLKKLDREKLIQLRNIVLNALKRPEPFDQDSDQGQRDELNSTRSFLKHLRTEIGKLEGIEDSPDDVEKNYTPERVKNSLKDLKTFVAENLKTLDNLTGRLYLNLIEKTAFDVDPPLKDEEGAKSALRKRFNEVINQLDATPKSFDYKNLIDGNRYPKDSAEELIIRWAISCELNHIEFYEHLVKAKEAADKWLRDKLVEEAQAKNPGKPLQDTEKTKIRTLKPSDSVYSPFNPRHPLYRQYYVKPTESEQQCDGSV